MRFGSVVQAWCGAALKTSTATQLLAFYSALLGQSAQFALSNCRLHVENKFEMFIDSKTL